MVSEKKHTILSAESVAIGYRSKSNTTLVAEAIHLDFSKGELIGLVGANGIGKSTLLRTLAGMQPSLAGTILVNGVDTAKRNALQLAQQLSVVLTESPASKNLTVRELVTLGRQPYTNWMGAITKKDAAIIEECLLRTDTLKLAHKKCFELSDGQLQRATIARALAQDTPLIILDEPTTHLDLYHRAYVLKLLKQLTTDQGKTILFSTHEIDLAIQLTDKMLVMTPTELFFDTPCRLIEAGRFSSLFPKDTIDFDNSTGRFSVRK